MNEGQEGSLRDIIRELRVGAGRNVSASIDNRSSTASIAACVICVICLILMGYEFNRQNEEIRTLRDCLRDQQAWVGVYGNDIATLKERTKETK